MKTKPILITVGIIAVLACGLLFARLKMVAKPEKNEISAFLKDFNEKLLKGDVKAAVACFEGGADNRTIVRLVNLLCNKTGLNGKSKPIFKLVLSTDDAEIGFANAEFPTAVVGVKFERDSMKSKLSGISFTIHKSGENAFKITGVDTKTFATDYAEYQNMIIVATVAEKDIYSPITLAAFKTAQKLKSRYDSILWFQHIDQKTWFYVIKGRLPLHFYWPDQDGKAPEKIEYKMGLVGPALKEVVPVDYDLVHNIGGTIDGLIEVEKGDKKGFYDTMGKLIVPVIYNQIFPLKDDENLALLKNGNSYFFLKRDSTITEQIADFKIADILPKIKHLSSSFTLSEKSSKNIMEYNSRINSTSLIVSPSYMADWQLLPKFIDFPNPLRKALNETDDGGDGSRSIAVNFDGTGNKEEGNWFQTAFYSVVNDYLGGRGGLYETKKILVIDKKQNKVIGFDANTYFGRGEGGGILTGTCNENAIRALNDSLFEFKTTVELDQNLPTENQYIQEGPYYYYLKLVAGKFVQLKTQRLFPTQFVKLDDTYLANCYLITSTSDSYEKRSGKILDHATPEILQVMKNEIYASYRYKFKTKRWGTIFEERFNNGDTVLNANVDDSLTAIDKYNINWIDIKLKAKKPITLASR